MSVAECATTSQRPLVLLAGQGDSLVAGLAAQRPSWTVIDLDSARWEAEIDAESARSAHRPVIAFIDWLPPAMSGLEIVRRLRDRPATAAAHITMVLEAGDASARSRALAAGADDYTVEPLDVAAVIGRVEDLCRSQRAAHANGASSGPAAIGSQPLSHGALVVDPAAYVVRQADRTARLRRNEFDILMHFMRRPNQVLSRQALVDQIGKGGMIGERTVDRRIARLRKTLNDNAISDPIRTVYGVGYVFDAVD